MNTKHLYLFMSALVLLFTSCQPSTENAEAGEEEHAQVGPANEIGLTQAQFEAVNIQLGELERKSLRNTIKANGVLDLPPQNKASVSSLVEGVVRTIYVTQGQAVEKGQRLALIEHPGIIELQEEYLKAQSELTYARKEFLRQQELLRENVIAAKKFQAAEAEYKSQQAMVGSLASRLSLIGISPKSVRLGQLSRGVTITAPIHGFVHMIEVNTGTNVAPASEMFQIVDNHHIHIDLQVFEKDIVKVKDGQKVLFSLVSNPKEQVEARIFSVGKAFEEETKSVGVHAEIRNNERANLLPGMFVNGRIIVSDSTVQALPDEAIITEGELQFVFAAQKAKESKGEAAEEHEGEEHEGEEVHEAPAWIFRKVEVRTGISDGGYTEVKLLEGLQPGEQLVQKGAYYISAQMNKGEGGHH